MKRGALGYFFRAGLPEAYTSRQKRVYTTVGAWYLVQGGEATHQYSRVCAVASERPSPAFMPGERVRLLLAVPGVSGWELEAHPSETITQVVDLTLSIAGRLWGEGEETDELLSSVFSYRDPELVCEELLGRQWLQGRNRLIRQHLETTGKIVSRLP